MSPNSDRGLLSVQSGAIEEATANKLRRIMRQRDHVFAKVVRMKRQVAEMPSIGHAKCSVLARMSSKHYDEFTQFHSTVVGLVDLENELERQEEIYIGFENLYVDLNVTLEELLTDAFSQEQKEYQKEEELKEEEHEGLEKHEQDQGGQNQKQQQDPDKETTTGDVVALIKHSSVSANGQDGQDQKQLQEEQDKETTTGDVALIKHSSVSANDQDDLDQKQLQDQDEETTTKDAALIKRKAIMVIKYLMLMWGDHTVEDLLLPNRIKFYNHQEYEQQFFDMWDKLTTTAPSVREDLLQMHRMALYNFFRNLEPIIPSEDEKRNNLCQMMNGSYHHIAGLILLGARITDEVEQFIINMMVTAMPLWLQGYWKRSLEAAQNERGMSTLQKMFEFIKKYYNSDRLGNFISRRLKLKHPSLNIPDFSDIYYRDIITGQLRKKDVTH